MNLSKITIDDALIEPVDQLTSLGVTFDQYMSMSSQINKITSSCFYELRKLYSLQRYLTLETRKILVQSIVTLRLDYCNSALAGATKADFNKLQRAQNAACRFIIGLRKFDSCREYRFNLHWLPIKERVQFKLLTFAQQILHTSRSPAYLKALIQFEPNHQTKRENNKWKTVPKQSKQSYGAKAFSVLGPKLWNELPLYLRQQQSTALFKKDIKTRLFEKAFNLTINS